MYIKKKSNFWRHCLYWSLQREGAGSATARALWGCHGGFRLKEKAPVILRCSTKAFQPRSCWRRNSTAFQGSVSHQWGNCYGEQLLTHHCHLHPHLPPQKLLHAWETQGGMQSPSPCPKHMHLLLHPFYTATTSRDKQRKSSVNIHTRWFCICSDGRHMVKTALTLRITHLPNFII